MGYLEVGRRVRPPVRVGMPETLDMWIGEVVRKEVSFLGVGAAPRVVGTMVHQDLVVEKVWIGLAIRREWIGKVIVEMTDRFYPTIVRGLRFRLSLCGCVSRFIPFYLFDIV